MSEKVTPASSLGKSASVRGYEIRRMPLGRYLEVLEAMKELPGTLAKACFPGMDAAQVLAKLKKIDSGMLAEIAVKAMLAAPKEAVRILSLCTGIPQDALLKDENIGLDGAAELAETVWKLNQLTNFTQAAARLAANVKAKTNEIQRDGSSA